jgi:hypothetical protein
MLSATVEGTQVKVGDWVCFKSDVEQCGRIKQIRRMNYNHLEFVLENPNGFQGAYIGRDTVTTVLAADCWIE